MLENIPVELAERIIDTLPIEISFVDAEDRVRYFSKEGNRIFKRTKAVIGRNVRDCHPKHSVDKVITIIEEMKSGERDVARFWIHLGELFVYIRYFAVRDDDGEYLGVLEVTQEITDIIKLEGEKRLL